MLNGLFNKYSVVLTYIVVDLILIGVFQNAQNSKLFGFKVLRCV